MLQRWYAAQAVRKDGILGRAFPWERRNQERPRTRANIALARRELLILPTPKGGGFSNYTAIVAAMLAFDGSIRAKITSAVIRLGITFP